MIKSFKSEKLEKAYTDDNYSGINHEHKERCQLLLSVIDSACAVTDLNQPSFTLHPLKGARQEIWAVTVKANWRITFRFENEKPCGALLKDNIDALEISITQAALRLDIARQTLSEIINGKAGISPVMALKLSKAFSTTPEFWLNMQQKYDLAQAKKNS